MIYDRKCDIHVCPLAGDTSDIDSISVPEQQFNPFIDIADGNAAFFRIAGGNISGQTVIQGVSK